MIYEKSKRMVDEGLELQVRHPVTGELISEIDTDQQDEVARIELMRLVNCGDLVEKVETRQVRNINKDV